MKWGGISLLFATLALSTTIIFYSVLRMTGFVLKQDVTRQQLLNYELSSRLLEEKFRANSEDFSREVRGHILETTVLNFSEFGSPPGPWETTGILIVNAVRIVSGKGFLRIAEDERTLLLLQYAFFLERNKRIPEAAKVLETITPILSDENRAFALLHSGYCQFLLGSDARAEEHLTAVTTDYPGTHFARSAQTILDLIKRGTDVSDQPVQKADSLFATGRYRAALVEYERVTALGSTQRLHYARCLEETGRVQESEAAYRKLAETDDEPTRKAAVRRLLILGNFLGTGEATKQFAMARASADSEAVTEIREAQRITAPAQFVKKNEKAVRVEDVIASASEELKAIPAPAPKGPIPAEAKQDPQQSKERKPEAAEKQPQKPEPQVTTRMNLRLANGRTLSCTGLSVRSGIATANSAEGSSQFNLDDLIEIVPERGSLVLNGDMSMRIEKMLREEGSFRLDGVGNAFVPVDAIISIGIAP